jgi:uncharacterized protein (TIGR03083 family)
MTSPLMGVSARLDAVELSDLPVFDPRRAIKDERDDLLALLDGLADDEWTAPTDAGHWRVKDVGLHLLDDDLGWLSRGRDGDTSGLLPTEGDYREFVRSLDAKNERWVAGAMGLSRRVVVDLLRWSAGEVNDYYASIDLEGPSGVIWASSATVPRWFDLCRDLTERWVHQQHIRDAVGQPGEHHRFLPEVLCTFVWAFPHQYDAEAPTDTAVQIGLGTGGTWHLVRSSRAWVLARGPAPKPAATLDLHETIAWRQLMGLPVPGDAISAEEPDPLVRALLQVRGIIA